MKQECTLASSHYVSTWKMDEVRSLAEVTELGGRYALLPDGEEKKAALSELCHCFHPYLMKSTRRSWVTRSFLFAPSAPPHRLTLSLESVGCPMRQFESAALRLEYPSLLAFSDMFIGA
jgi:hypothetical protein